MAGSDLDGDLYFVTWHEELILKKENHKPMDFPAATETLLDSPVTESDIIKQLKINVASDIKGRMSSQHLIFADLKGIYSSECLQLADLLPQMLDAPKTGVVPNWPKELKTTKAPDFLEKEDRRDNYESRRVLGKLYRHSKFITEIVQDLSKNKSTSNRGNDDVVIVDDDVRVLQESYDRVKENLMKAYGIKSEINIWRARFPDFRYTEEEKQNRAKLIDDFRQWHKTMQGQCGSVLNQLQKHGKSEHECRRQLHYQLRRNPAYAGLLMMLYDGKLKNEASEADQILAVYIDKSAETYNIH